MSATTWYFLRTESGELEPLARTAVEAFALRDGTLKASADGYVRYAEVRVEVEDRQPTRVLGTGFYQWRADDDGSRNGEHTSEVLAAAVALLPGLEAPPPGVIDGEAAFAKRRHDHLNTWQPTNDDLSKLRELVNVKAHRELM